MNIPVPGSPVSFDAVVLAGERPGISPVAEAARVCCKALAPVDGRPMVLRVLDTLEQSRSVNGVILCGLDPAGVAQIPEIRQEVADGRLSLLSGEASPSASAWSVLQRIPEQQSVLLTTADHALLQAEWVDYFLDQSRRTGADLVVAVARYELIVKSMPGIRRTVTWLRDDGYCGCNLFAFITPRSRVAADYWRQVEQQRKRPWRVIRMLGWGSVLRYLFRRLTLDQALHRLSRQFGLSIAAVNMPFPEASVDVDTPEDWELVKQLARKLHRVV